MSTNPLAALSDAGVSIWLDDLSRERLNTGNLAGLIADQHVVGVTTNPTIGWGLMLGSLAILGMPPFGVFASEFMILTTAMHHHSWATPFLLFALMFLILPTLYLMVGAFQDRTGQFTLANLRGIFTPTIMAAFICRRHE